MDDDDPNFKMLLTRNGGISLRAAVKEWRGKVPARAAAELLGIPLRTFEGIEQDRGFRYPRMLLKLIEHIGPAEAAK